MKINYVSLCSGYGAECIALKRLKRDFSDFDFDCLAWSEIEPSAINAHDAIHEEYRGRNLGDLTKVNWPEWHESIGKPHIDLLFASTPCFVAGTWIRTSKGLRKIECVEQGDYVLTHTNTYKRVLKTMERNYEGVTYSLDCPLFEELVCTTNHPLYVRAKRKGHTGARNFGNPEWLSPKEIMHELTKEPIHGIAQVRSYYIGYAINQKSELPKWNFPATTWKQQGDLVASMLDKEDFWYVMGRYVGDGWKRINGKNGNCLVICCSGRNRDSLLGALERLGLHSHSAQERTVEKVFISRNELVAFVERFGYYAYGKHIEAVIRTHYLKLIRGGNMDRRLQQRRAQGLLHDNNDKDRFSESLVLQRHKEEKMKQMAINLVSGVCCTLHANPGVMSPSNILYPPFGQGSHRRRLS